MEKLHYRVSQTLEDDIACVNWFDSEPEALEFAERVDAIITTVTCTEYEAGWPEGFRYDHNH